ncbi:MAG: LapA family protein [Mycobacterium sp.]|nr:LapA family protein [Mycobacterium sp.]
MGDTARDPVDHHRTTQPLAGETMKNTAKAPGLILVGAGVVAFVIALASFALARIGVGVGALVVALLAAGAGTAWLTMEGRRVRQAERDAAAHEVPLP